GSRLPAEKGELVYYAGTDSSTLDRVRPVLEHSSRDILHLGGIGAGTVVKLVTNMVSATMVQSLSEALAITQAYGISPQLLGQAISRNVIASPLASFKLPLMAERDFSTHFSLDNMRKDSIYAQELAAEKGIHPPAAALVSSIMGKLCREGHAEEDFGCLAEQFD
ncbi:MAG: NAD(P)-dependent oxidoreductase, partial [Akkermansia sp.]|nr:NAD(P)-dependent oxidoreductase [Akkermansia sp.]